MRALMAVALAAMLASSALAGLDPATDSFGFYFDTAGNTNCTSASAFEMVTTYLVLMNPSGPTNGFECSLSRVGAPHFVLSTSFGGCIDWIVGPDPNDIAIGCASDFPVQANGAAVLMTWTMMLAEPAELLLYIGPHSIPSLPGGLPVLTGNGVLRRGAVASGSVDLPVAGINAGNCPVSEEASSLGSVKSLFR